MKVLRWPESSMPVPTKSPVLTGRARSFMRLSRIRYRVPESAETYRDPDGIGLIELDEAVLLRKLGQAEFQLSTYGTYNSALILKEDFLDLGRKKFREILDWVRAKICPVYQMMKANGIVADAEKVIFFLVPVLMENEVHPRIAFVASAIFARRGLDYFCTHDVESDFSL